MIMKLLFSLALVLVASNQAKAQCPFTFCAGLNNIADQSEVINPEAPAAQQETCADLFNNAAAPGFYTSSQCQQYVKLYENVCCPAVAERQCFLCGDSFASFNAGKTFAAFASCDLIDQGLALLPAGQACDEYKSSAPMEVKSFCECPGAVAPNTCKVCGDNQEANATANAPGTNGLISCTDVVDIAKYVTDSTACADIATSEVKTTCCVDKASSGNHLSLGSLLTALVVGLAFTI